MKKSYAKIFWVAVILYCLAIYLGISESIPILQIRFKTSRGYFFPLWSIIASLSWLVGALTFSVGSTEQMQERLNIEYSRVIFTLPLILVFVIVLFKWLRTESSNGYVVEGRVWFKLLSICKVDVATVTWA